MSKSDCHDRLRELLCELYDRRQDGGTARSLAHAQGLADGYMRALSDLGISDDRELLSVVNEERRRASGREDARFGLIGAPAPELA